MKLYKNWQFEIIFALVGICFIAFALKLSEENIILAWGLLISGILVLFLTVCHGVMVYKEES